MAGSPSFHEDFGRAERRQAGSNRAFGITLAAASGVLATWPAFSGGAVRWRVVAIAAALLLAALACPALLAFPNRLWHRFGGVVNRVANPVLLGIVFALVVTPTAIVARLGGRDPLRLSFDRRAASYWIARGNGSAGRVDMRKQF
jgi:Na+-translocating ferredoxin:NAD+ oxidoreductase RnfD subunit